MATRNGTKTAGVTDVDRVGALNANINKIRFIPGIDAETVYTDDQSAFDVEQVVVGAGGAWSPTPKEI